MTKQTNLMRERQLLRLEVEYLRLQVVQPLPANVPTPLQTELNANGGQTTDDEKSA